MIRIPLLPRLLAIGLLASTPSFSDAQDVSTAGGTPESPKEATPPGPADADPERIAAAEALFDSMDMETLLQDGIEQSLETQVDQFRNMGLAEAGVAELHDEMLAFMQETMNWDSLKPEFIRIYTSAFTAQEMKDIAAFYATPAGKKAISLTPKLMTEGMLLGQRKVEARQAELQQRIAPIIQKHMAPR